MEALDPVVPALQQQRRLGGRRRHRKREQPAQRLVGRLRREDQPGESDPAAGPHGRTRPGHAGSGGVRRAARPLAALHAGVWAAEGRREEAAVSPSGEFISWRQHICMMVMEELDAQWKFWSMKYEEKV